MAWWEMTTNNNNGYSIYRNDECYASFPSFADGIDHHLHMFEEREDLQAENQRLKEEIERLKMNLSEHLRLACKRIGIDPSILNVPSTEVSDG